MIRTHINSRKSQLERNMVRVPNVVNGEADAAESLLQETGLGMSRDKMVYSEEIPLNMVSYQGIKENTPVEKDTMVTVWIGKGVEKEYEPQSALFPSPADRLSPADRPERAGMARPDHIPVPAKRGDCQYYLHAVQARGRSAGGLF